MGGQSWEGRGSCTVRSKSNKFEHDRGGPCMVRFSASCVVVMWYPPPVDRQTRLKALPSGNFVGGR